MTDLQRDIGYHEAKIEALEHEVRAMRQDVAEIKGMMAKAQGGIRTLLAMGSVAGAVGAGVMKLIGIVKGGG